MPQNKEKSSDMWAQVLAQAEDFGVVAAYVDRGHAGQGHRALAEQKLRGAIERWALARLEEETTAVKGWAAPDEQTMAEIRHAANKFPK